MSAACAAGDATAGGERDEGRRAVLILDGGMGRELKRMGAPFRQPEWSALALLDASGHAYVRAAHDAFARSGARVLTTNSYAVCPFHIGADVFASRGCELAALAGRLARGAADAAGGGVRRDRRRSSGRSCGGKGG